MLNDIQKPTEVNKMTAPLNKKGISRRFILKAAVIGSCYGMVQSAFPVMAWAGASHGIEHPMMNPDHYTDKGRCPNCGMNLNMWARTRHEFKNSEGEFATCSIRCLADMSANTGEEPAEVKAALYLEPEKMIAAEQASYLIGSAAAGTMTMKSKIAFASKEAAEKFAAGHGGQVVDFKGALAVATNELSMSRPKIEAKRKKKGKIADPSHEDRCQVCGMYPARFPAHRCQLTTMGGNRYHFCSSKCLTSYQANPEQYVKKTAKTESIWVTVFPDGGYEYAMGLYYLVGSSIMGPMGKEALPFRSKADAAKSAAENGGKVVRFKELTPALVEGE
ncbi:MAG: nitrous oxide reductase accessory protein NosL [Desulfocapsa sp.]|nr:nitrous oxide reductase accessory protein NosL [Desulfocapsa sp.]